MSTLASKVLLVDDSALMRRMAATTLASAGYATVDQAADADEALSLLEHSRYDVMVVDYYMPGMDGLRLVSHVRSLPHGRDLSILMVTSERDCCIAGEARDAGADAFLSKPVHPARLRSMICELLARKDGHAQTEGLRAARRALDAAQGSAVVIDRHHEVLLGNDAFWDEVGSGVDEEPLKSCAQVHAEGEVPKGCPLRDVERTGQDCERVIDDRGTLVHVAVSRLDAIDGDGEPLYLHVTNAAS